MSIISDLQGYKKSENIQIVLSVINDVHEENVTYIKKNNECNTYPDE